MIQEAKFGTVEEMRKQCARMRKAYERKEKSERNAKPGTVRSNELIRDMWAIKAEIEVLENWIKLWEQENP